MWLSLLANPLARCRTNAATQTGASPLPWQPRVPPGTHLAPLQTQHRDLIGAGQVNVSCSWWCPRPAAGACKGTVTPRAPPAPVVPPFPNPAPASSPAPLCQDPSMVTLRIPFPPACQNIGLTECLPHHPAFVFSCGFACSCPYSLVCFSHPLPQQFQVGKYNTGKYRKIG